MQPLKLNKKLKVETIQPGHSLGNGNWLKLERIEFKDDQGIKRSWERCVRKKSQESSLDAVDIHAIIQKKEPEILLVVQYRPAIERYCIEFPSGLVDPEDNDPIISAQRELKEETGYSIAREKLTLVKSPLAYEPGLTDSCCYVVKAIIEENVSLMAPELEEDEWSLQSIRLPIKGLLKRLLELENFHQGQLVIDSRVYSLASGLAYANEFL